MIDLLYGRHVGVKITKSLYGWKHIYRKSVEGFPEGLIFDIHDGGLDTFIQTDIRKIWISEWLQAEDPEDTLGAS